MRLKRYFNDKRLWKFTEPPSIEHMFGPYEELPTWGRKNQMDQLWKALAMETRSQTEKGSKTPVLFIHGSPGMGKTHMLLQLIKKNGVPTELQEIADSISFVFVYFNGDVPLTLRRFKREFIESDHLYTMAVLFYSTFGSHRRSPVEWDDFILTIVEFLRAGISADDVLQEMHSKLRKLYEDNKANGRSTVILVDEIMKMKVIDEDTDDDFAERCRSSICLWMGSLDAICDRVLFTSHDRGFMRKERAALGRPVIAATDLPLLSFEDVKKLLDAKLPTSLRFSDPNSEVEMPRQWGLDQLAYISGGHPQSVCHIIDIYLSMASCALKCSLSEVVHLLVQRMDTCFVETEYFQRLIDVALLAEPVRIDSRLVVGEGSETYESLVMRGALSASFDESVAKFIPTIPELFLHKWLELNRVGNKEQRKLGKYKRRILNEMFALRNGFTRVQFETLHSSWEQLMRYVRPKERYSHIPLHQLYKINLANNPNNRRDSGFQHGAILSTVVDGSSLLTLEAYTKGDTIRLDEPNIIFHSDDAQNPGWDRLLILEAFPSHGDSSGGDSGSRYLLPLFIQNKFSKMDATTQITAEEVAASREHCKLFLKDSVQLGDGFKWLEHDDGFVLLVVAKCDRNDNVTSGAAAGNVLFCFEDELRALYGPTLRGFIDRLVLDAAASSIV
jgi:hypothetical protein